MHTPIEFYVKLPQDLFRLGRKKKPKFDYIRTNPPRPDEVKWDVKLIKYNNLDYVDSKSGGLSLFNYRNPSLGSLWWRVPKGTKLPSGLHVSLDEGGTSGKNHFTIRPLYDMPLAQFLQRLKVLEGQADPAFLGTTNSSVG